MFRTPWYLAALALCVYGVPAAAGVVAGTVVSLEQIVGLEAEGTPFLLVRISGDVVEPGPACNSSGRFAIDLSTGTGQEAARIAQLLYVTGRVGRISGNGTCDVYSNSETAVEVDAF